MTQDWLPDEEFRKTENAAFEYCLSQKSGNLTIKKWLSMTAPRIIRKAFRAGAEWQRRQDNEVRASTGRQVDRRG